MKQPGGKDYDLDHMPKFIKDAPWYMTTGDKDDQSNEQGLKDQELFHQRIGLNKDNEKTNINTWYRRGEVNQAAAKKFRKGACTNCGAMTHKAKECLDRPRKIGARYTNSNIAKDELITTQ